MMAKNGTKRATKARKVKRDTLSGEFGSGEKAADKLAGRICDDIGMALADPALDWPALRDRIKKRLLPALSVTETAAKAIGAGWTILDDVGKLVPIQGYKDPHVFSSKRWALHWCGAGDRLQYVRLVPAHPPKSKRSTK